MMKRLEGLGLKRFEWGYRGISGVGFKGLWKLVVGFTGLTLRGCS